MGSNGDIWEAMGKKYGEKLRVMYGKIWSAMGRYEEKWGENAEQWRAMG